MNQSPDYKERPVLLAEHIIETGCTVRATAAWFGISKSTVHKDITLRLHSISPSLCAEVKVILEKNKAERHLRGGAATRAKYQRLAGESTADDQTISQTN